MTESITALRGVLYRFCRLCDYVAQQKPTWIFICAWVRVVEALEYY